MMQVTWYMLASQQCMIPVGKVYASLDPAEQHTP